MRYLFNAVSDPRFASRWPERILLDRLERNPGDMVYSHAVMNALAADDSADFVFTDYYYRKEPFSEREVDEINSTCAAFVCPLADMFSVEWIGFLRLLTDLIRRLRIPCVVPCIGGRDLHGADSPESFDADVSEFVRAVLDKSAVLGVRGESTARLLRRLGFEEGRHFVVLGCPTLYAYGPGLPPLPTHGGIRFDRCAVSLNHRADPELWRFVERCGGLFGRADLVSQWFREPFHFMLTDRRWSRDFFAERPAFAETVARYADRGRMRFFLNRKPWAGFLQSCDFVVGNRIHGVLLALLSGTPAAVVPFESRTMELAEFHGIPVLLPREGESDAALRERIAALDYTELLRRQRIGFEAYHSFFRRNGIATAFDHGNPSRADFPLERRTPDSFPDDGMPPWRFHSPADRATALVTREVMRLKNAANPAGGVGADPDRLAESREWLAMLDRPDPLDSVFSVGFQKGSEKAAEEAERAKRKVDRLVAEANEAKRKLRVEKARIQALQESLSWRLTAPFRAILRPFARGAERLASEPPSGTADHPG